MCEMTGLVSEPAEENVLITIEWGNRYHNPFHVLKLLGECKRLTAVVLTVYAAVGILNVFCFLVSQGVRMLG